MVTGIGTETGLKPAGEHSTVGRGVAAHLRPLQTDAASLQPHWCAQLCSVPPRALPQPVCCALSTCLPGLCPSPGARSTWGVWVLTSQGLAGSARGSAALGSQLRPWYLCSGPALENYSVISPAFHAQSHSPLRLRDNFNQNENVLLCSGNNANAVQTFHCLMLGVSA